MLAFLYCFKLWKLDGYSYQSPQFNSRHHDRCKVALKFIPLVTTSNLYLFSREVVQNCQLCIIRENSLGEMLLKWAKAYREGEGRGMGGWNAVDGKRSMIIQQKMAIYFNGP